MPQGTDLSAGDASGHSPEPPAGTAEAALELPLATLDHALAPLRRTVAWALREGEGVRYLEATTARWLQDALHLDLPDAIRDGLATIGGRLAGYDAAPAEERLERLRAINQVLARVDAVLGLPLHSPIVAPPRPKREPPESEPEPRPAEVTARPPKAKKRKKERRRDRSASAAEAGENEAKGLRRHRFGDPRATGESLASLGTEPTLLAALAAHGIHTAADLLWQPPVDEEVIRPVAGAGRAVPEGRAAVGGRVHARATVLTPAGGRCLVLQVVGAGPLRVEIAAAPGWLAERLAPGTRVVLAGTYQSGSGEEDGGVLRDAEWVPAAASHAVHLARYGLDGVDDQALRLELIRLSPLLGTLRDAVPKSVLEPLDLPGQAEALRLAHGALAAHPEARRRLAFDEALTALLGLSRRPDARQRGIGHPILHGMLSTISRVDELRLADAQQAVLEEIKRDLHASSPMLRLVTGEVGVGGGTVALAATVLVAESKSQVLSVAPERATAEARFLFAEPLLRDVGLVARLLDDDPSRAQRDAVRRGEVHVAFGGAGLLDADLEFRRLGLVVAEEGAMPRTTASRIAALRAPRPDALVFTTAPVPTMALIRAYADHAISEIRGVLAQPGQAIVLEGGERLEAYERVAERVRGGEQAWVFFPMVRGHDVLDTREVARIKATLESQVFPGARIGVYHGSMGREERRRAYEDFRHHRCEVLIATTIVEEGPAVPDATVAVVEHAEKLAWRHATRIRGHIARGRREATAFFILGDDPDPEGVARLRRLAEAPPFEPDVADALAEVEWPEGASPEPRLAWLQPHRDRALVLAAHRLAQELLAIDPGLRGALGTELARAARSLWPRLFDLPCPIPELQGSGRRRRRRRKRK